MFRSPLCRRTPTTGGTADPLKKMPGVGGNENRVPSPLLLAMGLTSPSLSHPSPPTPLQEDSYHGLCRVTGTLPVWLTGTLYRNGPGLWECGGRQLRLTADGLLIAGALRIDGKLGRHRRGGSSRPCLSLTRLACMICGVAATVSIA